MEVSDSDLKTEEENEGELEIQIKRQKRKTKERDMDLPEEIVINIIARVPLQSIIRFKLVCRDWKTLTESSFFHDRFHNNSNSTSSNWSILHGTYGLIHSCLEEVKLDLPRESSDGNFHNLSFANGFTQNNNKMKEITVVACTDGLVLLRLKRADEEDTMIRYYIGNHVLSQWIQLPPPSNGFNA